MCSPVAIHEGVARGPWIKTTFTCANMKDAADTRTVSIGRSVRLQTGIIVGASGPQHGVERRRTHLYVYLGSAGRPEVIVSPALCRSTGAPDVVLNNYTHARSRARTHTHIHARVYTHARILKPWFHRGKNHMRVLEM